MAAESLIPALEQIIKRGGGARRLRTSCSAWPIGGRPIVLTQGDDEAGTARCFTSSRAGHSYPRGTWKASGPDVKYQPRRFIGTASFDGNKVHLSLTAKSIPPGKSSTPVVLWANRAPKAGSA